MKLYQPKFTDRRTGKTKRTPRWYLSFTDHLRRRQRIAGYEDRDQTVQLGAMVAELVRCRQSRTTPDATWLDRLESVPADIQRRLLDLDLALPSWTSIGRSADTLTAWLDQFAEWLTASKTKTGHKRNTVYADNTIARIRAILAGCHLRRWEDLQSAKVETFISGLPISAATHTGYVVAIRHFVRWCIGNGLATSDPLTILSRPSIPQTETRRPLDPGEVRPLLEATLARGTRFGLSAMDRAALYATGLVTGLRRNELSHLKPEDFDLQRGTVRLSGAHTKDHRDALQPLPVGLLDGLRAYLADKDPKTRIWAPLTKHTYSMIRKDAVVGGLRIDDQEGRKLCFHSLRHTLRCWLVRAGVHSEVIDDILRHKPPAGAIGRRHYSHISDDDRRTAIESLPAIVWPGDLAQTQSGQPTATNQFALTDTLTNDGVSKGAYFPCRP